MVEDSDSSVGQLKRADHLLYVTLKYTRTTEVIKNTIRRLIGVFDYASLEILEVEKAKGKIKMIPYLPLERMELLSKVLSGIKEAEDYILLYHLLKHIDKSEYKAKEEYRKNVTLMTKDFDVDTPMLMLYFDKTKDFAKFANAYVRENEK